MNAKIKNRFANIRSKSARKNFYETSFSANMNQLLRRTLVRSYLYSATKKITHLFVLSTQPILAMVFYELLLPQYLLNAGWQFVHTFLLVH